jgi:hypothetical protein
MRNRIFVGPAEMFKSALIVEGLAVDAFKPGTLLVQSASGLATSTKTATVFSSEALVALEYGAHVGTQGSVDVAYTIGDRAIAGMARSGEFYQVRVANAQTLAKGTPLSSNGNGTLKVAVVPATVGTTSEQVLFYSDEAVTTSVAGQLVICRKA